MQKERYSVVNSQMLNMTMDPKSRRLNVEYIEIVTDQEGIKKEETEASRLKEKVIKKSLVQPVQK
ncbi:2467_t:CDS:2 [Gigaspora margarita]|uniref:2467_t:CDS:1 n=1 Tax=Gigaspora margarita TaxID=4874 RepID=A0ABN7VAR8_GIGMA|nr:2467_t:CDS:2 [Gigaspora margarita]